MKYDVQMILCSAICQRDMWSIELGNQVDAVVLIMKYRAQHNRKSGPENKCLYQARSPGCGFSASIIFLNIEVTDATSRSHRRKASNLTPNVSSPAPLPQQRTSCPVRKYPQYSPSSSSPTPVDVPAQPPISASHSPRRSDSRDQFQLQLHLS